MYLKLPNNLTPTGLVTILVVYLTMAAAGQSPPHIVTTSPEIGATNVNPKVLKEISVTFDRDMSGSMSWCGGPPDFPNVPEDREAAWRDKRTCVLPVSLEPGRYYCLSINSLNYQNFRGVDGIPAKPKTLAFTTVGAAKDLIQRLPKVKPPVTEEAKRAAFDEMWQAFDKDYAMFVIKPDVDWTHLREEYRPKALAAKTTGEFAQVCAEMLAHLRDLHVWLRSSGEDIPVFNRPRSANANPSAVELLVGPLGRSGAVAWAVTTNNLGYLVIDNWSDDQIPAQCDRALKALRGVKGLIVDVRLNGGGSENLALKVAARFIGRPFVYGFDRERNGPRHEDLSERNSRVVEPRGPWRFDKPVILLIGQKCMSSNESFIGMMMGDTNLTTMGDHTCGSSGDPEIIKLPLDMTVSVPQWIDYLPDGALLDEHGFVPQVWFKSQSDSFDGERDDLLVAALKRMGS